MNVVDLFHAAYSRDALLDLVDVYVGRGRFEDEDNALPEGQAGRPQDNDCEYVGADWINIPDVVINENNGCSDDHANRVEQITEDVEEGRAHVYILLLG